MLRLGALTLPLLAILLAGCATALPSVVSSPSPETTEPGPSAAETVPVTASAEVLFRFEHSGGIEALSPYLTLYADGRLLSFDSQQDRLWVRVLSATGIEAFVAEVLASDSFGSSHHVPLELLPGVEAPGIEVPVDRFTLEAVGGPLIVVTTNPFNDPRWFAASPERDVLIALAERLMDPEWLEADAWVEETPIPFVPEAYILFSGFSQFPPQDPICPPGSEGACDRDVSTEIWPVTLPPDGIGVPFISADGTQSTIDHGAVIDVDFAEEMAAAMRPDLAGGLAGSAFLYASVPWRERNGFYDLQLRPLLPEESASCDGKSLPR